MSKAIVTVTAFNSENYQKRIAMLSEVQIHTNDVRVREPQGLEFDGNVGVVIDPSRFPEMDRFVVSVKLHER